MVFVSSQVDSSLWGQQKPDADKPVAEKTVNQPDADKLEANSANDQEQELEIRYAEAYLNLMQATLSKYDDINRQGAGTIRPEVIQSLQEAVREARLSQNGEKRRRGGCDDLRVGQRTCVRPKRRCEMCKSRTVGRAPGERR